MPKIAYKTYKFSSENRTLLDRVMTILEDYRQRGYMLSLRQLYYQCVTANLFPNTEKSYNKLGDLVCNAREAGLIDWEAIEDRARSINHKSHWPNPASIIQACADQFNYDLWSDQPKRVEVWVEKEALVGVIARACRPLDVTYFANKGYASASSLWEAARATLRSVATNWDRVTEMVSELPD